MEGLPRLPMLTADYKYAMAAVDFAPRIKEYIVRYYQEDPEKYDHALKELNNLREQVCRCISDVESCTQLKRYYAQLLMLKNRFPMESGDEAATAFTWLDKALDMPNPIVFDDVNFELACIMHNIGATHAAVASSETRGSLEGIKFAFNHFQMSAWAFQHLRDKLNASNFSIDFDPSLLTWYTNLMLAQAQECILEKSLIDHRKHTIIAKIAVNIRDVYVQCKVHLENASLSDIVGSSRYKEWTRTCSLKSDLYGAIASLYMGQQADEEQKMGERLAWYNLAADQLARAQKTAGKDKRDGVKSAFQFASDVILGKQANAKKENDFIYHEKVTSPEDMPNIQGVALVKPIGFDPLDPAISGDDLFATLVPINVLKSVSLYSEEKAKYMRAVNEKVDSKDQELQSYCISLKLEDISLDQSIDDLRLPDMLLERSAAFNAQPDSFPKLLETLQRVGYCSTEADHKLEDLQNRLAIVQKCNDIKSDAGFIAIKNELNRLNDAHTRARTSNSELQRAIAAHSENLRLLAMPLTELNKRLAAPVVKPSETPEGAQLKRMLEKMEEMKAQRAQLVDQLKKQLHADDLTKRLLSEKDVDSSDIYERELRKHDKQMALVEMNLSAQPNILSALTDANANFAERRREIIELNKCRGEQIVALVTAFDVYEDVRVKAEQGRVFYSTLFEKVRALDEAVDAMEEAVSEQQKKRKEEEEKEMLAIKAAADAAKERMRNLPPPASHYDHDSAYPPSPTPSSRSTRGESYSSGDRPNRPRLGDYLDFYRAKQAGAAVPFPSTSTQPSSGGYDMNASNSAVGPSVPYSPVSSAQGGGQPMPNSYAHPSAAISNGQQSMPVSSHLPTSAQSYAPPSNGQYDQRYAAAMSITNQQPPTSHQYTQPANMHYDHSTPVASISNPSSQHAHQYAPPSNVQFGGYSHAAMAASTAPPIMSVSTQPPPPAHQYMQPVNGQYTHQPQMTSVPSSSHPSLPIPSQQAMMSRPGETNLQSQPPLHSQYMAPVTSQYGGQPISSHQSMQPSMSISSPQQPPAHQYTQPSMSISSPQQPLAHHYTQPSYSNNPSEMSVQMPASAVQSSASIPNHMAPAHHYATAANSFLTPSSNSVQPPSSVQMSSPMPSIAGQFAPQPNMYEQARPAVSISNAVHPPTQQFLPATNTHYGQEHRPPAAATPPISSASQPMNASVQQPPTSLPASISPWHQRVQEPLNRPFSPQQPINQFQSPAPQPQQYAAPPGGAAGAAMGYGYPPGQAMYAHPAQQQQQMNQLPPRANMMDMDVDAFLPAPLLPNKVEEKMENSNLLRSSSQQQTVMGNSTPTQGTSQTAHTTQHVAPIQATMQAAQPTVPFSAPVVNRDAIPRSDVGAASAANLPSAQTPLTHQGPGLVGIPPSSGAALGSGTIADRASMIAPPVDIETTHKAPGTVPFANPPAAPHTAIAPQAHTFDAHNTAGGAPVTNGNSTTAKTTTNGNGTIGSSNGGGHASLEQLLNPSTFDIGEGDQVKLAKRRVKEQFDKGNGAGAERPLTPLVANPADPFSGLDPLWCMNKKAG
uniref:BRO1 domain-containing protein n=1 Tax=Plectus sambesii TaxID=2011161 RepID=A0A914VNV6_9BILA